jgi:hypothetical protein
MRPALFVLLLSTLPALAADKDGWVELLKPGPETPWKKMDKGWILAKDVSLDAEKQNRLRRPRPTAGPCG